MIYWGAGGRGGARKKLDESLMLGNTVLYGRCKPLQAVDVFYGLFRSTLVHILYPMGSTKLLCYIYDIRKPI